MDTTYKDLYQGLPQGFSTLLALLNQTKMGQQHFGPNDSMLASSIMHPVEGLNKAGGWLQNQVQTASQAPVIPSIDPRGAAAATQAGLNLAGLLQTGAFPTAPSGPGVLGTIRGSKIKQVLADLEARGFDTKNPWYHGGTKPVKQGSWQAPSFFTKNREDADWFAKENSIGSEPSQYPQGVMHKVFLKKDGALDMRDDYMDMNPTLVKHLENAGIENQAGEYEDFYYPQVSDHSPYEGSNINDTMYHPDFQQYLKDNGFNSLRNWDTLDRGEIDTRIMLDSEDVYNVNTRVPTREQYLKNKIPSKVAELVRKKK